MHNVSAAYTLPTLLNTLKPPPMHGGQSIAQPRAASGTARADATSTGDTSASGIGTTFLNLLSKELQNQDPTDPVDSTAMVGQMISLNQLDQLISINQTLTGVSTATTASGSRQPASVKPSMVPVASPSTNTPGTVPNQLPFDPVTMMPLANSSAAASLGAGFDAGALGSSSTHPYATGGK